MTTHLEHMRGMNAPRSVRALLAMAVVIVVAAACRSDDTTAPASAPKASVVAWPPEVSRRDQLSVTVQNVGGADLNLKLCVKSLELLDAGAWKPQPLPQEWEACIPTTSMLQPGERYALLFYIPPSLALGVYRASIVMTSESASGESSPVEAYSTTFRVRP